MLYGGARRTGVFFPWTFFFCFAVVVGYYKAIPWLRGIAVTDVKGAAADGRMGVLEAVAATLKETRRQPLEDGGEAGGGGREGDAGGGNEVDPAYTATWSWRLPLASALMLLAPSRVEQVVRGPFATPSERKAVEDAAPQGPDSLANYLAWRRTMLASLIALGLVQHFLQMHALLLTWTHHDRFEELGHRGELKDFQAWTASSQANFGFLEYSKEKGLMLFAGVLAEVLRGAALVELLAFFLGFVPLVLLLIAMLRWSSFAKSRFLVLSAWAVSFFTPFMVSIFPTRSLLSFEDTQTQVDAYVHELAVAMHLEQAQEMLMDFCGRPSTKHLEHQISRFGDTLQRTCDGLAKFPLQITVPCLGRAALCHIDLGRAVDGCKQAQLQFDMGNIDSATAILETQCDNIEQMFSDPTGLGTAPPSMVNSMQQPQQQSQQQQQQQQNKGSEDRSWAFRTLVQMLQTPFHTLVPGVEVLSMSLSALHAAFLVLPAVAGIAPGLMSAGAAMKVLAPHSELPGAMILTVPIVLASTAWLMCTVLVQYLSSWNALALLAVSLGMPLAVIGIGGFYEVTLPSHRAVLRRGLRAMAIAVLSLAALGTSLVLHLAGEMDLSKIPGLLEVIQWCDISWFQLAGTCAMGAVYSFALTSFGATDWIMSDISAQRRYWNFWISGDEDGGSYDGSPVSGGVTPYRGAAATSSNVFQLGTLATPVWMGQRQAQLDEDVGEILRHQEIVNEKEEDFLWDDWDPWA